MRTAGEFSTTSQTRANFLAWWRGQSGPTDLFETLGAPPQEVIPAEQKWEAYAIACFREEARGSFLNHIVRRLRAEGAEFFRNPADRDAAEWQRRLKAIRRDVHKAHAFVRFKKTDIDGEDWFVAWHRPQHDTLDLFVRLFCRRFSTMRWSVLTAGESAHFSAGNLRFGDGFVGQSLPLEDTWEDFWRTYYVSIFNPARLMTRAMKKEMPVHHWQTLPEARLIPTLIRDSRPRVERMVRTVQASAERFVPSDCRELAQVTAALPKCEGCGLAQHCKVTPGAGNPRARLVLVGEQPGDEEEKSGTPFVGPAGQVLRRAVAESGLDWREMYVTNAVKHFKYEPRGERRLHRRPEREEVAACRPWLQMELQLVEPEIVLCLGSTAALSVTGRLWPVERYRGSALPTSAPYRVRMTYHPAAILRASEEKAATHYRELVEDLKSLRNTS